MSQFPGKCRCLVTPRRHVAAEPAQNPCIYVIPGVSRRGYEGAFHSREKCRKRHSQRSMRCATGKYSERC